MKRVILGALVLAVNKFCFIFMVCLNKVFNSFSFLFVVADAPFKCNVIDASQVNIKSFTKIVCINEVTGFIIQSDAGIKADMPATVDVFCKFKVIGSISRYRVAIYDTIKDLLPLFLSIILFYLIH